ncbi:MAG TPA: SpoIIE family protein phosphatase [Clostridium sp.]|nr:SpoIIE family protein phosphatase [Clostridium sp.]
MKSTDNFKNINSEKFIKYIINGMQDWVRVIDTDDNILYVNEAMSKALEGCYIGQKCYEALGREKPCDNCTSRKVVFKGVTQIKEEIIQNKTFSVMSSPIKDDNGNVVAVVEVLRDISSIKELHEKIICQNKKLKNELHMARKLQESLLPRNFSCEAVKYSYVYKPCEALGGDFLDIFKIDDNNIGLYIADVSGHGLLASMLTIFIRASINKNQTSPSMVLKQLFKEFNNTFNSTTEKYITIFYAVINIKNSTITYSNAGHNVPPILFNTATERFDLLRIPGIPISNWVENSKYKEKHITYEKNDRLFLYSDGIIELKNNENKQYGEENLLDILLKSTSSPTSTLNKIIDDVSHFIRFSDFKKICDDITMMLIEF